MSEHASFSDDGRRMLKDLNLIFSPYASGEQTQIERGVRIADWAAGLIR